MSTFTIETPEFRKLTTQHIKNKPEIQISERSEASEDKNHRQKTVWPAVPTPAPLGAAGGSPGRPVREGSEENEEILHCFSAIGD